MVISGLQNTQESTILLPNDIIVSENIVVNREHKLASIKILQEYAKCYILRNWSGL